MFIKALGVCWGKKTHYKYAVEFTNAAPKSSQNPTASIHCAVINSILCSKIMCKLNLNDIVWI